MQQLDLVQEQRQSLLARLRLERINRFMLTKGRKLKAMTIKKLTRVDRDSDHSILPKYPTSTHKYSIEFSFYLVACFNIFMNWGYKRGG